MPISVAADSNQSAIGNWQLAILISVSLAAVLPTMLWGIPSNLDLTNHFRFALPFYDAIVAGDAYPGWLAESNGGYGDPSFRFYPPALYYLLAAARFVIGNWYGATLFVFAALSITSALGMYFWTRSILPAHQAAWASLFYALAPYHLNQLYQAVLLAEWAASAVLPFVFAFVERVCDKGRPRDIAGLAATFGILVFTHLPLTVIGSLALVAYALVRVEGPDKLRKLAKLSFAAVLGLSVSAVYWVTMVSEVRWIGLNEIQRAASVDYRHNFVFSTLSPDNLSVWWMNITMVMTLLLFAPAFLLLFKKVTALRRTLRPVIVLTALALFMSVPFSRPIWWLLEPLQETQFPWRWLILISMGGSILAAAGLPLILGVEKDSDRVKRMLVFGAMAIAIAFTFAHVVREAQYFSSQRFERMLTDVRGTACVNYWFTIWSRPDIRPMATEVEVADRVVDVTSWQPEHRKFSVMAGPAAEARIRTFYYPHWIAKNESGILPTRPAQDGALLIALPANATTVELDFREPGKTNLSTLFSLSGLIVLGALSVPFRRRASTMKVNHAKQLPDPPVTPTTWQSRLCATERQQQEHYDNIAADYEAHYSDEWSIEYRRKFIYEPMFEGLDLSGMKVLDAMCGSGQTTNYLLDRGASVTGLDISNEVVDAFQVRWSEATVVNRSLLDSGLPDNEFDCVVVVGGLHHIHPNVKRAVSEIHRVLKPGGHFCFMEPHSGSLPDLVRRVWYRFDPFFSDNEASIDVGALQRDFRDRLELRQAKYLGNVAFLLVLNSLIFRIPPGTKKLFAPALMKFEPVVNKLQTKLTSCFVVAQWQKL